MLCENLQPAKDQDIVVILIAWSNNWRLQEMHDFAFNQPMKIPIIEFEINYK